MNNIIKRTLYVCVFAVAYIISSYSLFEMNRFVKKTFSYGLQYELLKIMIYFILSIILYIVIKTWADSTKNNIVLIVLCIITFILGLFVFLPFTLFQPLSGLMITYSGAIASHLIIKKFNKK